MKFLLEEGWIQVPKPSTPKVYFSSCISHFILKMLVNIDTRIRMENNLVKNRRISLPKF